MGNGRGAYRVLVGRPAENGHLENLDLARHRWKNNIKSYLQEVG
jgi:hypothetical protein